MDGRQAGGGAGVGRTGAGGGAGGGRRPVLYKDGHAPSRSLGPRAWGIQHCGALPEG